MSYTDIMKTLLAQLRLLLAVILLIAGGGAIAGFAERTSTIGGAGVTADVAALSTSASHKMIGHVASAERDDNGAPCDSCPDCVHSTASGCCVASISAGECGILHDAPDAVRFMAGKAFLATGIDPEALLQPPQILT